MATALIRAIDFIHRYGREKGLRFTIIAARQPVHNHAGFIEFGIVEGGKQLSRNVIIGGTIVSKTTVKVLSRLLEYDTALLDRLAESVREMEKP